MGVAVEPGRVVGGKYILQRPLARGAMGEVWVATHATLGGELALKLLSDGETGEDAETAMARFRFEAQVAAKLSRRTRHIVSVTDHGEEDGRAYLVMELVEGESLAQVIERGRCSLELVTNIVVQVAKGLAHAHAEGVFHRDLKPANVLLARDEDGGLLVKILDFGIAKATRAHRAPESIGAETEAGMVLGTPKYMSPEQARGLSSLDHRCDLWALAVIAYEALCGVMPFDGETTNDLLINVCSAEPIPARSIRPDLPPALDAFFAQAFASRIRSRFDDTTSFATAFYEAATSGVTAKPAEALVAEVPVAYEPPKRKLHVPVLVALGVAVLIGLGALVRSRRAPEPHVDAEPPAPTATIAPELAEVGAPPVEPEPGVAGAAPEATPTPKPVTKPTSPPAKPVTTPSPATTSKPIDKGAIL